MKCGPKGGLYPACLPSGPLPTASARGRGEGRVPRRGKSVPPATLAAPVRKEAKLLHPARSRGISSLEVVDDHPARREIRDDVPDRRAHHLDPLLRAPARVAVEAGRHHLSLPESKQTLSLRLVVPRRPVAGR